MKGDGYIKIKLKFIGSGYKSKYQVIYKLYNNEETYEGKTYNGEVEIPVKPHKIYKLHAKFLNEVINTSIYTNTLKYIYVLNNMIRRPIILSLKDYYYNLPIEKGEIIFWQK